MNPECFTLEAMAAKAREAAAEGCVLLRNENRALPLEKGCRVAVFGRTQMNYYKSGLGSGGLVNARYVHGLWEGLTACGTLQLDAQLRSEYERWTQDHPFNRGDGWAGHPWVQEEMPVADDLVAAAEQRNDAAVVILGRTAGEDRDNDPGPGSWLLTPAEETLLAQVCSRFPRTIVLLNVGNIIDMTWVERYQPAAVMYLWQGGQDGGHAAADVLTGRVNPSGRLTDTIARRIEDYPSCEGFGREDEIVYHEDVYVGYRAFETFNPEAVLYPFGAGLSYTDFHHETRACRFDGSHVHLTCLVTNTGDTAGREVVQIYAQLPQGTLGQPRRVLIGYGKTQLLSPGAQEELTFAIPVDRLASYDDAGLSGHRSCELLEAGEYRILAGHDVRQAEEAFCFTLSETVVLHQREEACTPVRPFDRLYPAPDGSRAWRPTPARQVSPAARRLDRLPAPLPLTGDQGLRLEDVQDGRCTLEQFVGQMNEETLCCIVRGEGMSSPRVTPGTASAMGGVSDQLVSRYGIPSVCCADGPSGIRMDCGNKAYAMPNGTCQACTWNDALIEELYVFEGLEMRKYQVDVLLGPGMNIHRHPLCGRNFEYFSEDPLITGRMAAAQLRGLHRSGVEGTLKHYACNNQEKYRRRVNAVVSERALRQIYLKGFEIAVKEGPAHSVMTSYNPLNSWWTASHYDLNTTILRGEWGFDGVVMTDWWAAGSEEGGKDSLTQVASMIRAQNDLFMVTGDPASNSGGDDSLESLHAGTVTLAEYQRSAMNICRFAMTTPAFRRLRGQMTELDQQLQQLRDDEGDVILHVPEMLMDEEVVIPGDTLRAGIGADNLYQMKLRRRGQFRISGRCRALPDLPDTMQLSMAVLVDNQVTGMKTITGADTAWQEFSFDTREIRRRFIFYLKVFLVTSGLEIDQVTITRIQTFD